MRESKAEKRKQAVLRGLEFIYQTACEPANFDVYGFDYLFSFYWIASTSKDKTVRRLARKMGRERALNWRRENPAVADDADADEITHLVFGSLASDGFGLRDGALKNQIKLAARRFPARDYFWFDPLREPPPTDAPNYCQCGAANRRGRKVCRYCKAALNIMSRYEVYVVAIIRSYLGKRFGAKLGASYEDVLKRLEDLRPYPRVERDSLDFIWAIYAVTHVVYSLNHYGLYRLSPRWLPMEFEFLKNSLDVIIESDDPETAGEILDSLKSFGLSDHHPLIRKGMEFLLSRQNEDGSWGLIDVDDVYDRYHPTLTAINGLRDYDWRGERLSYRKLMPLIEEMARQNI